MAYGMMELGHESWTGIEGSFEQVIAFAADQLDHDAQNAAHVEIDGQLYYVWGSGAYQMAPAGTGYTGPWVSPAPREAQLHPRYRLELAR